MGAAQIEHQALFCARQSASLRRADLQIGSGSECNAQQSQTGPLTYFKTKADRISTKRSEPRWQPISPERDGHHTRSSDRSNRLMEP
jgi:hypothetical protein